MHDNMQLGCQKRIKMYLLVICKEIKYVSDNNRQSDEKSEL